MRQDTETLADPPDADLVSRARAGDRTAFEAIYRRHAPALYRFAVSLSRSVSVAEDVVHDVFLTFMGDLGRYDGSRAPLAAYLFGIARNHLRSRTRRERRHVELEGEPEVPRSREDLVGDLAGTQRRSALRVALAALPVPYREAIVLCVLQEMKYEEAARILSVPVGTVRSRLHRARQMLSDRLHRAEEPASVSTWRLWRKFS